MLTWLNIIEIFIIVLMVYAFYVSFIKNTSSEKLVRGLFGLGVIWALSFLLPMVHLHLLGRFLHWLALFLSVALIVIFQPELRKFLALMGNIRGWKNIIYAFRQDVKNSSNKQKSVEEIIKAVTYMSEKHTGALIVFPEDIDDTLLRDYFNIKVTVPKKGKLKRLIELAKENAKEQMNLEEETLTRNDSERLLALKELQDLLGIENLHRMESFDNSHLFGTFYVGGMVVFDDFLPNKDLYRKYKISSDVKDDLSAMREVLYRRYFKTIMNEMYKPDLIVMDGGDLQVNTAKEILKELNLYIPIIGLVKDDKHRTSYIINEDLERLEVSKDSKLFLFLTRIQDEVHRYAITYHRNIKSKGTLSSLLDSVPGIGEVRKKELLKKFGSLKKMKEASIDDLSAVVGSDVAKKLHTYLQEI